MVRQRSSAAHPSSDDKADEETHIPDIGGAVLTGVKWKVATQVLGEGTRVLVTLILARLLSPGNYGVAGIAIVCATFASLFVDPALGTALVQRRKITEADRSTVFWTTLAIGLAFTVAGVACSGLVADAFGVPQVRNLFAVLSLTFVLNAVSVPQISLLMRSLAYRSLEIREMAATAAGAIVALSAAFAGFGPWAIVLNFVVFSLTSTVLVWRLSNWRPRAMFSVDSLKDLGGFGLKLFWSRVLMWGNYNVDNMLVGRFLGAPALGAYSLAYNVMFMPMTRIGIPLTQVLSPAYARMQSDPRRLQEAWLRSKRVSTAALIPCFATCAIVAPDLVRVAFGAKWHNAVVPLQLLCVAGTAHALVALNQSLLQARGKGGALLRLNLIMSAVTLTAFAAGLPFGIVGVAGFYAAGRWLLVPVDTWITSRNAGFSFWSSISSGLGVLPLAAVAGGCAYALRLFMVAEGVPAVVRLLAVASTFVLVYALLLRIFARTVVNDVREGVRRRRGESPTAGNELAAGTA
jgi:O-antigen/teichoic acid export membrane protein